MRRARHCHGVHGASPLPSLVGWRRSAERRQLPTLRWVLAGILPFSPRAWPQGQCAWASRQSAPPEPMLADVACGSDFYFAAAIRARLSIVARVALLRVASLSSQFDSPACRSLTWAVKVALVWSGAKASCHSALAHGRKANALGLQGNLLRQNPCSLTLLAEAIFILLRQFARDSQSSLA